MSPPKPKRPPGPSPTPQPRTPRQKPSTEVDLPLDAKDFELPFDTTEVTPLRADDPAPQRVPQYPVTRSRRPRPSEAQDTAVTTVPGELAQSFGPKTLETVRPVFLYVEKGPGAGQLIPVNPGTLVIGRSSSADLRLQHPSVSRRHAQLTREGDRFLLKDLGSQNGTFLNKGRLLVEREIACGDTLAIGTALLKLRGPVDLGAEHRSKPARPGRGKVLGLFLGATALGLVGMVAGALWAGGGAKQEPLPAAPLNAPGPLAPSEPVASLVDTPVLRHAEHNLQDDPAESAAPGAKTAATRETKRHSAQASAKPAQRRRRSPVASTRSPSERPGPSAPSAGARTALPHALASATSPSQVSSRTGGQPSSVAAAPRTTPAETGAQILSGDDAALAAYRDGDLATALRLSSRNLARPLTRFQTEYGAGRRALAAHDAKKAADHFRQALAVDQDLAHGAGSFHARLTHQLEQLSLLESSEPASSPRPASPPPADPTSTDGARDAIDAAFGD